MMLPYLAPLRMCADLFERSAKVNHRKFASRALRIRRYCTDSLLCRLLKRCRDSARLYARKPLMQQVTDTRPEPYDDEQDQSRPHEQVKIRQNRLIHTGHPNYRLIWWRESSADGQASDGKRQSRGVPGFLRAHAAATSSAKPSTAYLAVASSDAYLTLSTARLRSCCRFQPGETSSMAWPRSPPTQTRDQDRVTLKEDAGVPFALPPHGRPIGGKT